MSVDDFSIELQERDGYWNKLGCQPTGGSFIIAESLTLTGDLQEKGCLEASWVMKMDPRFPKQCIEHFTPIVVSRGGEPIWSGRIIAAPTNFGEDSFVTVQCQGWGQHLKDEVTNKQWIIQDLSQWVDQRTLPGANLSASTANYQIEVGTGGIILSMPCTVPAGTTWTGGTDCGIVLDMGEGNVCEEISFEWTSSANTASTSYYVGTGSTPQWRGGRVDYAAPFTNSSAASGTFNAAVSPASSAGRYVFIFGYTSGTINYIADVWLKISNIRCSLKAAYTSGATSVLYASTIIPEVIGYTSLLISNDTSRITATTTPIPNFPGPTAYRYGNELIDLANSIHGYVTRLTPDPTPIMEFFPQPTDYSFMVGANEYSLVEPAAQDGRGVANRVIVEYEDAAGVKGNAESTPTVLGTPGVPQFSNPFFEVDASGWTVFFGTAVRSLAAASQGVASLALTTSAGSIVYVNPTTLTGLTPGKRYVVKLQWRRANTITGGNVHVRNSASARISDYVESQFSAAGTGSFTAISIPFTAPSDGIAVLELSLNGAASTLLGYLDAVEVVSSLTNIVDRRGFQRTFLRPMSVKSTAAAAAAIALLELQSSEFPPFRGTIGIQGRVRTKGGGSMHVSKLPALVGDAILIEDIADPNTGAMGRQGVIQQATYNADTDTCEITIDDPTGFLEVLRSRLSLLGGA